MNTKNILIAGLVGAVITLALTNIPFVNLVNCLICAGFWVGPLFATWLYKRNTGSITTKEGIWVGVVAGAIAGVIGFLLSLVGVAGAAGMVNQVNSFLPAQDQIEMGGIEGVVGNIIITSFGVIFDIVVGAIGGWIGSAIFKNKSQAATQVNN
jgi:hypothetical protein